MKAQGVALLYVSHRFAEVLALCDRVDGAAERPEVITTGLAGWTEARLTDAMIGAPGRALRRGTARCRRPGARGQPGLRLGTRVHDVTFVARRGE